MMDLIYFKDLYAPLYGDKGKPEDVSDMQWDVLNRKTVALIRNWVEESIYSHIENETNAYNLWKKLEAMYERKTAQNKASLIRRLVNLKYKDGRSVTEHLSDFQGLVNQLSKVKLVLEDELIALLLLSSLPDSWDTLVVTLSNSSPEGTLTFEMVKNSMLNEEARRIERGMHNFESDALIVDKRGRSKNKYSNNRDKLRDKSRDKRAKSKTRKNVECFHCGKMGHMKRECRTFKREQSKGNSNEKNEAKESTAIASDGDDVIIACDDECVNIACQDTCWVIDFGSSFHVTTRCDFFTSYTSGDFG